MKGPRLAVLLSLVIVGGAAHSRQLPAGGPAAPGAGNLRIDFGPAQGTHLELHVAK
jgi:hypothetical protein